MNAFLLKISSPEGDVFNGQAVSFFVCGAEGELTVMAGHIPFVSSARAGECKIKLEDGTVLRGHTNGGIIAVSKEKTIFLSASFRLFD